MSALEEKILKIYEKMQKVYEAGQLASVNITALTDKIGKIPFVNDEAINIIVSDKTSSAVIGTDGDFNEDENAICYHYKTINYYVGETIYISGACSQSAPLYVFKDAGGNVVDMGWGAGEEVLVSVENYNVVVPEGAMDLYVNMLKDNDFDIEAVRAYTQKFEVSEEYLSDVLRTLISAKGINTEYIWYANVDAVVKTSNPIVKLGGIADYKIQNCIYTVLSASGVLGNIVTMDLKAKTVDAIVSAGNFSKFHNGDLLLYAGGYEGVEAWRWIPQAEAKEDRDGWESAWDKQQVNKVPGMEALLEHMPKEITFHTEAGLLNWISKDGIHYVKAQTGNSANPVVGTTKQSYIVYVGREFNGSDFTGKRFQLAHHLATNRYFYRIGTVASGGSFDGYAWKEIT